MRDPHLLKLYDQEVRAQPPRRPDVVMEQVAGASLVIGPPNFVCHWDFPAKHAAEAVSQIVDLFLSRRESLTWDIYDHDRPRLLGERLASAGFVVEHLSTLLVLDLSAVPLAAPSDGQVRRVSDHHMLADFVRLSEQSFGVSARWQFDAFADRLDCVEDQLFNAYDDDVAVGSARMEISSARSFAGLFGGAVSPQHRGRGHYRAMVDARAAAAAALGVRYLWTSALETSRPILERLGFTPLDRIARWVFSGEA